MFSFFRRTSLISRNAFLVVCLCVALIRVIVTCWLGESSVLSVEDYNIAQNIAGGHGFTMGNSYWPTAVKAPVYPLFLSAIISLVPDNARVVAACLQHFLMSLSAFMLLVALQGFMARRAALLASAIFLFHPSYLVYPSTLEATNLIVPLAIMSLLFFQKAWRFSQANHTEFRWHLAFAISSALLVLCQPLVLPIVFFAAIKLSRNRSTGLIILGTFVLLISPWILRNALTFHQFIPFKSPLWMNFYVGFEERSHGLAELNTIRLDDRRLVDSARIVCQDVELEPFYKSAVLHAIQDHPKLYAEKTLVQALRFWTIPPNYDSQIRSPSFIVGRLLPISLLFVGLIWSICLQSSADKVTSRYIIYVLLYFTLIYALTHTSNIRFKLDVEWLQCISIGIVFSSLFRSSTTTDVSSPNITRT